MRTTLDEIRREIDSVDKQIHSALIKRTELVDRIAKEKKKKKSQTVHPGREAALVKKLLKAHSGALHEQALFKIWREVIGASSVQQSENLKVAVTLNENDLYGSVHMMEMAKDYFGSVLPIKKVTDPQAALVSVKEGDASFAVLPWPEDNDGQRPWWLSLVAEAGLDHTPQIFGRLPFNDSKEAVGLYHTQAALISSVPFEESGDDRSLVALAVNDPLSRGGIVDKMQAGGFKVNGLYMYYDDRTQKTVYLLDVDGFVVQGNEKLDNLLSEFDDPEAMFYCIGGYPVPVQWG